jgi:hypothetical protein
LASKAFLRTRAIYAADDRFRKLSPAKRKLARDEHVRPLINSFFEWVQQARLEQKGRNLATKALGYATNQEHELRRVLADGRLPLDNTRAERSLRKIVVLVSLCTSRSSTRNLEGSIVAGIATRAPRALAAAA